MYFLKSEDEVFGRFKEWKTIVEKHIGQHNKTLRTDNRLEFCNTPFDEFWKKEGVVRHHTIRHTPQQNEVVESMNQTLLQGMRCMRLYASLPNEIWVEVENTASYLVNRSPSTTIDFKTIQEVSYGTSSNYSSLRIFGCLAYAHVNDGKLEPRAIK